MKKVVILIDGQNLYYALKSLGLQERDLDWNKIFQSFIEPGEEFIRAYWFRPNKLSDMYYSPKTICNQVAYHFFNDCYSNFKAGNFSAIDVKTLQEIKTEAKNIETWLNKQRIKFAHLEYIYDQLCLDNNNIEIVKKGMVKVNPFNRQYEGEKGVDIALAVKMMSLSAEKKCGKIILISGDYDYAEAICYTKNNLTKVHIVNIHKELPPKHHYMSRDLSILADKIITLTESDIRSNYLKPN